MYLCQNYEIFWLSCDGNLIELPGKFRVENVTCVMHYNNGQRV